MSEKESFDGAVKDNYFDVLVCFDRRDDLIQLRNGVRTENIERRMINGYSPIVARVPRKMYLLRACCCVSCAFHVLSPLNFPWAFAESVDRLLLNSGTLFISSIRCAGFAPLSS